MSDEVTNEVVEEVVEAQVVAEVTPEPVVVAEEPVVVAEEPVAVIEEPAKVSKPTRGGTPSPVRHVVSGGDTDDVYLDKCVYMNKYARKSLTVHHVQRRLVELGYRDAGSDKDGWYGELTHIAVASFQKDRSIAGEGCMNSETFVALFDGDQNVTVHVA
jgi:peptidoglycan hydrolase-like protein with peptidoglycan-binding domain